MSPADLTDAQLGARALDGDRDAFVELFARHESGLFNVAHRMTGSRDDAADVTQEAFLRVFARLDDLSGREVNLAAYLHRTARNLVFDRSAQRARETPVDEMERVAGPDTAPEADPALTSLVGAQGDEVRAANARLPERHRLALALRELEGMGYDDIGRVLDITPGAVAQLLARARMALRRELRLEQIDLEAMDPACRGRLGEIGALIDGELDADRAHVLGQHLELCPSCRAAREAFEDAGRRYRAWLPLPLVLGLGADTARAAEARRLVRFPQAGRRGAGLWRAGGGRGGAAGRLLGSRRAAAASVGAGAVALSLLVAVPVLVATRSGSTGPPPPPAAAAATGATTSATVPSVTTTSRPVGATTAVPPSPSTAPAAPIAPAAGATPTAPTPAAPTPVAAPATPVTTVAGSPPSVTPRTTTVTTPRPRPAAPAPPPGPAVAGAPPPATPAAPPPPAPPTRSDAPPGTPVPEDPAPADPGPADPPPTPTRTTPPDIPFPTTFTGVRPPVVAP